MPTIATAKSKLGRRVRDARVARVWSEERLGAELGQPASFIRCVERDWIEPPEQLLRLLHIAEDRDEGGVAPAAPGP